MAPTHVLQSRGFSFATGILRLSRTEGFAANFPERRLNEAPHPGFDLIGSVNTSAFERSRSAADATREANGGVMANG